MKVTVKFQERELALVVSWFLSHRGISDIDLTVSYSSSDFNESRREDFPQVSLDRETVSLYPSDQKRDEGNV